MPAEVIMPKVDMDMSVGTISAWHATDGQRVEKSAPLFDIETDKASMEIESPASGVLRLAELPPGVPIPIGQAVAWIYRDGEQLGELPEIQFNSLDRPSREKPEARPPATAGAAQSEPCRTWIKRPRASPLARREARKLGIPLAQLAGSGPRGRVTRRDVEMAICMRSGPASESARSSGADASKTPAASGAGSRAVHEGIRRETAERLSESNRLVPQLHLGFKVDSRKLLKLLNELNLLRSNRDVELELLDFVPKASAIAFQACPQADAIWAGEGMVKPGGSEIALDIPALGGRLAPVIRDAGQRTIAEIATERDRLRLRAASGELSEEDCAGGVATIRDMSRTSVLEATSTIEPPRSIMLVIGSASSHSRFESTGISDARNTIRMTLTIDNRVIEAETGASYLDALKSLLEAPLAVLAL